MLAPTLIFNAQAALDAVKAFVLRLVPEVKNIDVYRWRPSAVPGQWRLSVVLSPVNMLPLLESYMGEESVAAQRQRVVVTVVRASGGLWRLRVLGQDADYPAGLGDSVAVIRNGLIAAVAGLGLPVVASVTPAPNGQAALQVLADVAGVSMLVALTDAGDTGQGTVAVLDDNVQQAVYNWGVWTLRVVVRDIESADQTGASSRVGEYLDRLRFGLQGQSIPVVNGLAYPYERDALKAPAARLSWRQTLGPVDASGVENNIWRTTAFCDFVFDVPVGLVTDIPSMVVTGPGTIEVGDA